MMKKKVLLIAFLVALCLAPLAAEKLGTLEGLFKPQMIKVYDNQLFVVEGQTILVYSLKDLKLQVKIGKRGEGPGEFKYSPSRTLIITVYPQHILAESRNKLVYFDKKGKFIREEKKVTGLLQTLPLGENFLVHKIIYNTDGKNYFAVFIYDKNFQPLKELYRQAFFTFENKVFVMPDGLNYAIMGDKLLVEKSPDGFIVDVYDSRGNKIRRISRDYEKVSVPQARKDEAYKDYTNIPFLIRMRRERGDSWVDNLLKSQSMVYPDYYPAIQDIAVDGEKIYVRTYRVKDNQEEYVMMDITGKVEKTIFLPKARKVDFLVQMQGDKKFYNIHKGKFYYLKSVEEDDDEEWQIHVQTIK